MQQWCWNYILSFINKDRWFLGSPDLDHLDYSIWDESETVVD